MALGLGHKYWVNILTMHAGTLEECLEYMHNNPAKNGAWYELHGIVKIIHGVAHFTGEYRCDLVCDGSNEKSKK